eukprot:m.196730 g.196730  ORF g.196730 m.196730 type:complete len:514 (-) comp19890_c0_seq1:1640-3181(-)
MLAAVGAAAPPKGHDDEREAVENDHASSTMRGKLVEPSKKSARKVFHKTAKNNKFKVFLFKRDFFESNGVTEPVDGVMAVNPEANLNGKSIYARINVVLSHSRAETTMLMSGACATTLHTETKLLCKSADDAHSLGDVTSSDVKATTSRLQRALMRRAEWPTVPFSFQLPPHLSSSVALQVSKGRGMEGDHIGVDYELLVFADKDGDRVHPRHHRTVRMNIRKLTDGPADSDTALTLPPSVHVERHIPSLWSLGMGGTSLQLTVSLDKPLYRIGDTVNVSIGLANPTTKAIKGIQISIRQHAELRDSGGDSRFNVKATLSRLNTVEGFPIRTGESFNRVYPVPLWEPSRMQQGQIALDGALHDEGTLLAASTRPERDNERSKEGIVVTYEVKVKLDVAWAVPLLASDTVCRVPFSLYHPRENVRQLSVSLPELNHDTVEERFDVVTAGISTQPVFWADDDADQDTSMDGGDRDDPPTPLVFEEFVRGRAERTSEGDSDMDRGQSQESVPDVAQ